MRIKNYIIVLLGILIYSCSDEYFDVNVPTGSATEEQLSMEDLLGPSIYHTVMAQYWAERSFGNYTQYFTGQGGTTIGPSSITSTWSETYLYALPNLNTILMKAEETNSNHYSGIAKVLIAINLGLATDSYENIPYSESAQGTVNSKPAFDSQEEIYASINSLLNEAISELSTENASEFAPGSGDIVYGGDSDKWLKAAYTLKARYALHLTEVNGIQAAEEALTNIENGFSSNDDDFQVYFEERNINPWHSREVLAPNTGNVHDKIGDQLVSYMNGTTSPFTNPELQFDPRLPVYADNEGEEGEPYRGYVSGGDGVSSDNEDANTDFADAGFYTSLDSPIPIITYAEAMFIKAEAEFLINGGTTTSSGTTVTAYTAYLDGIQANMDKLGVDGTNYLADSSIAMGEGGLMLNHIMKEKYIANFLNPETFVDFRRYDFSSDVFLDLELPLDSDESEFPGEWYVRAVYPDREETRNPENVLQFKKSPVEPVWWDR
ncbi:SusD/RagB family nutrient-binding outer membrane lipoprotein [Cytophaga sp. FL35]|uniref:SusD/RagB family nutrient-binding outer membrane lipoprotein n=1 Tax=Cytophaga sp. FL35 TaxID=1904456 RepID=UPI001CA41AA7|nr:SusD/RagB family nutrient-binding outer membrane lipoprotein [Cytophaga sp. FL35]